MAKRKGWAQRITEAEVRGHFTLKDRGAAGMWFSCAIGERYNFPKPAYLFYPPNNYERALGVAFMHAVGLEGKEDIPLAKKIYAEIQALPPVT